MEAKKLFVVVGTDARQAAAGRVLERAGYAVGGAEQVALADYILLPLPLDAARTPLAELLRADPSWNQGTALALLVFVMLYAPCFVTLVVIRQESGSWKWVAFSIAFNTLLAFGMAVGVYQTYRFLWMGL